MRDYEEGTRPPKIQLVSDGHALSSVSFSFSLSLSDPFAMIFRIAVSPRSIYEMVPSYRHRLVDRRLSGFRGIARKSFLILERSEITGSPASYFVPLKHDAVSRPRSPHSGRAPQLRIIIFLRQTFVNWRRALANSSHTI